LAITAKAIHSSRACQLSKTTKLENVMTLFPFSIYSMRQSSKLSDAVKAIGATTFEEGKRWIKGHQLFKQADVCKQVIPIIFASAELTDRLLFWGLITDIRIADDDVSQPATRYSFHELRTIPERLPLSSLTLRSSGKRLSDKYIRPYAICYTPDFIVRSVAK
jgi:hypothetical protein